LVQPEAGFRFSLDALLLASFARARAGQRLIDLGTGCGVAAFGFMLGRPLEIEAVGVDMDPAMIRAARENADRLGLAERFQAFEIPVDKVRERFEPEGFDLAVCNPPYRAPGGGRVCAKEERTQSRFETRGGLDDFLAAGFFLLKNQGLINLIYPADRLAALFNSLARARLEPKRMMMVHGRAREPARLVLVEARKNGRPELRVEPPLFLHQGEGGQTRLTGRAVEFCPFLACNPGN